MLCNNSVLNVDEEFVHQCVVTLYGDVIRCASSIMHMFACILLQPDEGADDYKFGRAGKVSCCSNCFCACMLLLMVAIFSQCLCFKLLMFVTMYCNYYTQRISQTYPFYIYTYICRCLKLLQTGQTQRILKNRSQPLLLMQVVDLMTLLMSTYI